MSSIHTKSSSHILMVILCVVVFLYVRQVDDSAFTALLLEEPTLLRLCSAVSRSPSGLLDAAL